MKTTVETVRYITGTEYRIRRGNRVWHAPTLTRLRALGVDTERLVEKTGRDGRTYWVLPG